MPGNVSFEQRMEAWISVDASEPEPEPDAEPSPKPDIVRLERYMYR